MDVQVLVTTTPILRLSGILVFVAEELWNLFAGALENIFAFCYSQTGGSADG